MKGYNKWHYSPYIPIDRIEELNKPYICRLAPHENDIELEWFDKNNTNIHKLFYSVRDKNDWKCVDIKENIYKITGLEQQTEYQIYIENDKTVKSNIRLVKTGFVPGIVVNYLHPEDNQYAFSGNYLCSPSIVKFKSGTILASMDLHASRKPQNLTLLFRSDDNGDNWRYVTDIFPCFWGTLFEHDSYVYMLSVSNEYGDLLIGRSEDEGKTWTMPTVIMRGSCSVIEKGMHKAPVVVTKIENRFYVDVEYGAWTCGEFSNGLFSIDEDSDFLVAENWSFTGFLHHNKDWENALDIPGAIEGSVVQGLKGEIYNILRYAPNKALVLKNSSNKPEELPEFYKFIDFPMAHSKFEIRKHKNSNYIAVGNRLPLRNILSVFTSKDLINWEFLKDILNYENLPKEKIAFQYPAFVFDGKDEILVLSRTAFNNAANFHDNNYQTFHRVSLKK